MKDEELPEDDLDDAIEEDDADDDLLWEDGDPADRRKDPLRKPGT